MIAMLASNPMGAGAKFTAPSLELEGFVICSLPAVCVGEERLAFETEWITSDCVAARCPEPPRIGQRIVAYVDILGRLEGQVSAHTPQGFRLDITMSESDRSKFEKLVALMKSRAAASLPLGRRHERIVPLQCAVIVVDSAGASRFGRFVDVSRSGAAVKVDGAFAVGDMVRIGERTHGSVVRLLENGIAVEFFNLIPFEEFTECVDL